jgi:hypothetical protein
MEAGFTKRYGSQIWQDRESLKVKRDMIRYILNKYRNEKLSPAEKAEYKMARAQIRAMNRRLYPNPWVRLVRNLILFAGNIIRLAARLAIAVLRVLIGPLSPRQTTSSYQQSTAQKSNDRPVVQDKQQDRKRDKQQGNKKAMGNKQQTAGTKTPFVKQSQQAQQGGDQSPAGKKNAEQKVNLAKGQSIATQKAVIRKMNPRLFVRDLNPGRGIRR